MGPAPVTLSAFENQVRRQTIASEDINAAALRRIYFKIFVSNPSRADYLQIFEDVCAAIQIAWRQDVVEDFYERRYVKDGFNTSGAHPGFLLRHIIAACWFLEIEPELTEDLLELSWRNVAAGRAED